MAECFLFKLAYNGTIHRFRSTEYPIGEELFTAIKRKVASIVNKDDFELYWRDEDDDVVLDTVDDLSAAVDFAKTTRTNMTKSPCVQLVVREEEEEEEECSAQSETETAATATPTDVASSDAPTTSATPAVEAENECLTTDQEAALQEWFNYNMYVSKAEAKELADAVSTSAEKVEEWFRFNRNREYSRTTEILYCENRWSMLLQHRQRPVYGKEYGERTRFYIKEIKAAADPVEDAKELKLLEALEADSASSETPSVYQERFVRNLVLPMYNHLCGSSPQHEAEEDSFDSEQEALMREALAIHRDTNPEKQKLLEAFLLLAQEHVQIWFINRSSKWRDDIENAPEDCSYEMKKREQTADAPATDSYSKHPRLFESLDSVFESVLRRFGGVAPREKEEEVEKEDENPLTAAQNALLTEFAVLMSSPNYKDTKFLLSVLSLLTDHVVSWFWLTGLERTRRETPEDEEEDGEEEGEEKDESEDEEEEEEDSGDEEEEEDEEETEEEEGEEDEETEESEEEPEEESGNEEEEEESQEEEKTVQPTPSVQQMQQAAAAVLSLAARERELKIKEKTLMMKEEVFERRMVEYAMMMEEMEEKMKEIEGRIEEIEEGKKKEKEMDEMSERLKKIE